MLLASTPLEILSPREEDLKFDDIEEEIVEAIQAEAADDYGMRGRVCWNKTVRSS